MVQGEQGRRYFFSTFFNLNNVILGRRGGGGLFEVDADAILTVKL